ncbi:MAG: hypothetical protein ACKOWO_06275, partial [Sediminibacterium sp.]
MNQTIKYPPEYYLSMIKYDTPFSFSRFGDGEVLCMFNSHLMSANCDGSEFSPVLIEPMKQIFINKHNYYHCLLDCTFEPVFKDSVDKFKKFIDETCPDMPFYDGEVWQQMSFSGRITELVETISSHDPVFVGGSHLSNIGKMKGFSNKPIQIVIPDVNAFYSINTIIEQIIDLYTSGSKMFLFSAGYSTKIIIDQLFPYLG